MNLDQRDHFHCKGSYSLEGAQCIDSSTPRMKDLVSDASEPDTLSNIALFSRLCPLNLLDSVHRSKVCNFDMYPR